MLSLLNKSNTVFWSYFFEAVVNAVVGLSKYFDTFVPFSLLIIPTMSCFFRNEIRSVPSPWGVFGGLSPIKQSSKAPKLKHETSAPQTQSPPIENFLATVLDMLLLFNNLRTVPQRQLIKLTTVQQCLMLYSRGGQLIWLGGHCEKAVSSRGPYLLIKMESKAQLKLTSELTLRTWREFQIWRFFLNASAGPWKGCGGPHVARGR